jgi:predicted thioesterase
MDTITPGLTGQAKMVVGTRDTALRVGSGAIEVLATPVMIALLEEAALDAIEAHLPEGMQSLGTHLSVSHVAATPVGMEVTATARLVAVEGRQLTLEVEARDAVDLIGAGTHTRVVVTAERFVARVAAKSQL